MYGGTQTRPLRRGAAIAALLATGLMHPLLLSTPRPGRFFGWIMTLATAAAVLAPFAVKGSRESRSRPPPSISRWASPSARSSPPGRSAVRKGSLRTGPPQSAPVLPHAVTSRIHPPDIRSPGVCGKGGHVDAAPDTTGRPPTTRLQAWRLVVRSRWRSPRPWSWWFRRTTEPRASCSWAPGLVAFFAGAYWFLAGRGVLRLAAAALAILAPVVVLALFIRAGLLWVALSSLALLVLGERRRRRRAHHRRATTRACRPTRLAGRRQPFLVMNPRSGGGKVAKFGLKEKAEALGAEVALLDGPGLVDVAALARDAVARGADLLGVAGGDGTQALVAGIAAEHDLPFLVISAGTRNHFALDLGLDRDDPSTCLDALTDGVELRVDLGMIGGRTFVNNASFGAYAEVVQSPEYRDDKTAHDAADAPRPARPASAGPADRARRRRHHRRAAGGAGEQRPVRRPRSRRARPPGPARPRRPGRRRGLRGRTPGRRSACCAAATSAV